MYTFVGQITLPSFIAEMKEPKDFPKGKFGSFARGKGFSSHLNPRDVQHSGLSPSPKSLSLPFAALWYIISWGTSISPRQRLVA
jgi:hypothetical protein